MKRDYHRGALATEVSEMYKKAEKAGRLYDENRNGMKADEYKLKAINAYETSSKYFKGAAKIEERIGHERKAKIYRSDAEGMQEKAEKLKKGKKGENTGSQLWKLHRLNRLNKLERMATASLTPAIVSMVAFASALAFSSFNITGLAINDTTFSTANYIALIFFAIGIFFALIFFGSIFCKKKKKAKKKAPAKKSKKK